MGAVVTSITGWPGGICSSRAWRTRVYLLMSGIEVTVTAMRASAGCICPVCYVTVRLGPRVRNVYELPGSAATLCMLKKRRVLRQSTCIRLYRIFPKPVRCRLPRSAELSSERGCRTAYSSTKQAYGCAGHRCWAQAACAGGGEQYISQDLSSCRCDICTTAQVHCISYSEA